MDARFAHESRPGAAAWEGSIDGVQVQAQAQVQVASEENAKEEAQPTPTPTPTPDQGPQSGELQLQQAPYQHSSYSRYRYHSQTQHTPQISNPTLPPPPTDADGTLSPGRTVERLARKLSKQDLQQRHRSRARQRQRHTKQPTPQLPASTASVEAPESRSLQARAAPDHANRQSQLHPPPPSDDRTVPWLPIPTLDLGEPIEIDEAYVEPEQPEDKRLSDVRRPRRQTSGQLRPAARPVDQRLEGMIADGTQCNVRTEPRPVPTPTQTPTPMPMPAPSLPTLGLQLADPGFIEPDPDCAAASPGIEIDETDTGDMSAFRDELLALAEGSSIPLRYASGPGGVRKYTVGGVALRYRLSADVAMRCANVVRSRPRMRKRNKTRHGSATTSAVTSPAMSSAHSPPLPPTEFPL